MFNLDLQHYRRSIQCAACCIRNDLVFVWEWWVWNSIGRDGNIVAMVTMRSSRGGTADSSRKRSVKGCHILIVGRRTFDVV